MTEQIPGRPSRSTLNGWRPNQGDKARLVQASSSGPSQAIVGDVVNVYRLLTPPGKFYNNEPGCLLLQHSDGSNSVSGEPLTGTAGVWEQVLDEQLRTASGTRLDQLTREYRVFLIVEAVRGLSEEEGQMFLETVKR
jgi:hypothetical protein